MMWGPYRSTRWARRAGSHVAERQGRRPAPRRQCRTCRRGRPRDGSAKGDSMPADLRARLGQLELPSPVLAASGCAGAGRELAQFTDVARIGAVITKSVTLEPRAGNPTPRLAETPSGLLSAAGLQGPGLDGFLRRDLPWLLSQGARAFVSIAGHSAREYGED